MRALHICTKLLYACVMSVSVCAWEYMYCGRKIVMNFYCFCCVFGAVTVAVVRLFIMIAIRWNRPFPNSSKYIDGKFQHYIFHTLYIYNTIYIVTHIILLLSSYVQLLLLLLQLPLVLPIDQCFPFHLASLNLSVCVINVLVVVVDTVVVVVAFNVHSIYLFSVIFFFTLFSLHLM